jgi:hypothetical protein
MSLISLVIVLIVVGVLLWAVNTFGASFIDGKILKIINIVVVIFVVLWLVSIFIGFGPIDQIRVGRIR